MLNDGKTFFGRTDLWTSLSRAKFDEKADFEVRKFVDPQKPRQKDEKQNYLVSENPNLFLMESAFRAKREKSFEHFAPKAPEKILNILRRRRQRKF